MISYTVEIIKTSIGVEISCFENTEKALSDEVPFAKLLAPRIIKSITIKPEDFEKLDVFAIIKMDIQK